MARRTPHLLLALTIIVAPASAWADEQPEPDTGEPGVPAPDEPAPDTGDAANAESPGEVIEISETFTVPGSAHTVGSEDLGRFELDDVHRVLAAVPGVYIREEDGYGLRPNIGMRGSGSERSAKIALMEDGVLIAPAPYSAPAAYYFPLVTRMERIDVLKGPASIIYGPNTVGGAVNLVPKEIPFRRHAYVDVAGGMDLYGKAHGRWAESTKHFGAMVEGVKIRSDGFKELDGGGSTGFDKNDVSLAVRANTDPLGRVYNQVTVKAGWSDERSNETYTGLTDDDFAANPYRRYAGTRLDRMTWDHWRVHATHRLEVAGVADLSTTLYRHDFRRAWGKLNGFAANTPLSEVLANPTAGTNALLYGVLTGENDSSSPSEALVLGTNDRDFLSQGVQSVVHTEVETGPVRHDLRVGTRVHYDRVDRYHTTDTYMMTGGDLIRDDTPTAVTLDARGTSLAWATFVQDKAHVGPVIVTAGLRAEVVGTEWADHMDPSADTDDRYAVFIPGAGVFYKATDELGFLAGVHRGFVPVSPGQTDDIDPESSVNYELGARFAHRLARAEVIGFFNDYQNLKGTCTFSTGCSSDQVDDEFNGGEVQVWGVEAVTSSEIHATDEVAFPLRATYTFNHSEFQTDFTSANPQWGDVEAGDELPYLPSHQLAVEGGVSAYGFEATVAARYNSAMRDTAGHGPMEPSERTDAYAVIDLAAHYRVKNWGEAYLTVGNLLDTAHIVSRRPFGARPAQGRLVIVGYKNSFF